ncbi:E3 ubiquitin-protein ligase bre1 [Marasmius sp. AFHP31]|nr:E3 ubiquitin-protein ligase bre1 [Marasmius sp. AFHP31]
MGKASTEGLEETAEKYLVVVAKNGEDDKPDFKSLRAFVATTAQGVVYNTGIWHQPMTVLEKLVDTLRSLVGSDEELQQATQSNKSAEEALKRGTNQKINDLKNILAQRNTNLARIRKSRDQQGAELHERKVKESTRISSCEENKALAASRAERITVLNSQLRRCRLQLAAQSNSEDIISLLLNGPNDDVTVVEKLRTRLSAADNRLAALEQACSKLDKEHPDITQHIQAESRTRCKSFRMFLKSWRSTEESMANLPRCKLMLAS